MTTQDYREKSPLMIFLSYFKNHRWLFAADVTCAVGIAAIDLLFPLVTRSALYEMLPNQMYRTFFTIMVIVAVCYVLRSFLNYVVAYYGHTFGIRVEADIRRDLFRHMQELSVDFYDRNRTGKLMARLTSDLFELTELAHHGPEDLITSVLTILGALIVMASIRWQLAVIVALTIPVFLTVAMAMRGRMGRRPPRQRRRSATSIRRSKAAFPASAPRKPSPTRRWKPPALTRPMRNSKPPSGRSTRQWACSTAAWSSFCAV